MVLSPFGPDPLRRPYAALRGMMERAVQMRAVPIGCKLTELIGPMDFWER